MSDGSILFTVPVLRIARCFLNAPSTERQYAGGIAEAYGIPQWQVHRTLTMLEERGWLSAHTERVDRCSVGRGPRRLYSITPLGRQEAAKVWDLLRST